MEESTCTEHYTEGLGMDGEGVTEILLSIVSINRKAHSQKCKIHVWCWMTGWWNSGSLSLYISVNVCLEKIILSVQNHWWSLTGH